MSDTPYKAPSTNPEERDDVDPRVVIRTSVLETWLLCSFMMLVLSLRSPAMLQSPRVQEWLGFLPEPAATVVFLFVTSAVLGAIPLTFLLLLAASPPAIKIRFPVVWLARGRPRFLGAVLYTIAVVAFHTPILWFVAGED